MFPMGMDYRPTRAELEGRAPPAEPDAVQRSLAAAGDGVLQQWGALEDALEEALEGAPRDAALPAVLAAAAAHALHVRLLLPAALAGGAAAAVAAAAAPAEPLALCAAFYAASLADALLRWRSGGAGALSAALHAAAPLVWGLSALMALFFYAARWREPSLRAAADAAQAARGLPVASWLHEVHAGPALLALLDLLGGKNGELLHAHTPRAAAVASAAAAAAAAAAGAAAAAAAAPGGSWPLAELAGMGTRERAACCAAAAAALVALSLAARAAAARRGAAAVAPPPERAAPAAPAPAPAPAQPAAAKPRRARRT
jgi:hypothetical protein